MFLLLCYLFLFVLQRWHVSKLQIRMILRRRAWCYNLRVFWSICCRTLMFLTFLVWPSFWTWRCAMMNLCTGWKKDSLLLLAFAWLVTDVHDRDNFFEVFAVSFFRSNVQGKEIINILIRYHIFHESIFLTVHGSQLSHIFTTCYQ